MQALYALWMDANSSLEVAIEEFRGKLDDEAFRLNQPNAWRDNLLDQALEAFKMMERQPVDTRSEALFPAEVKHLAKAALDLSSSRYKKDKKTRRTDLAGQFSDVYDYYLKLLLLLPELQRQVEIEQEEGQAKHIKPTPATEAELKFQRNPAILAIGESEELKQLTLRRGISWEQEQPLVRNIYRQDLKKNPQYLKYLEGPDTEEAHMAFARWLGRTFALGSPVMDEVWEERNSRWTEQKQAVSHLMQDTFKAWKKGGSGFAPLLQDEEWKDAAEFQLSLYDHTLATWEKTEQEMEGVIEKWEITRVALVDQILLHEAITEFTSFPNIPPKVTINEYLEVAKLYSTPQSQKFLNGVLDKLLEKLTAEKKVRKSALGMMDVK